jgi:mono/diheme cytochrome c family protein
VRVFGGHSCAGCHSLTGIWSHDGFPLEHAADKYDAVALRRFIRSPKSVDAHALMPPQNEVTDAEIDAMAAFLVSFPRTQTNSILIREHH